MFTIEQFRTSSAYDAISNGRDKAVIDCLLNAASNGNNCTVDHLRRKLRTTNADIDDALVALSGAFEQVEYHADDKIAMWNVSDDDAEHVNTLEFNAEAEEAVGSEHVDDAERDAADQSDIPASDEEEPKSTFHFGGKHPEKYRALYKEHGGHCGDDIGEYMTQHVNVVRQVPRKDGKGFKKEKSLDMAAVYAVARQNGISTINGNNNGQIRMNLSNMLRKLHREGKDVRIGTAVVKGRTQAELESQASEHAATSAALNAEYAAEAERNKPRAPQF